MAKMMGNESCEQGHFAPADHLSGCLLATVGEDEIAWLTRTISSMQGWANAVKRRIDGSLARQRQFVSDASHELLTPIAGLRAHLEEAQLHPDQTELDEFLGRALKDVDRLQAIVTELLVLARVGTSRDAPVKVDLAELARSAASHRGGRLPVRLRLTPGATALGVESEIRRALANILDNAQRHAKHVVLVEVHDHGNHAEVAVADDGDGVAAADRERIFERFTRLDTARSRSRGGTGLGLAIVRAIAEAHRGTVHVEDSFMGGARFVLRLPLG